MSSSFPKVFETALEVYTSKLILGEGGSGRVFLVTDSKGNDFAVKFLSPNVVSSDRLHRFKNELQFLQKNTHPNILSVLDHGFILIDDKRIPFYIMRAYPSTLRKLLCAGLPFEQSYGFFQKILDGIEEAHNRNIWHRDLKPENILVDPFTSSLVIADFGIAHFAEEELYTAVQTRQTDRLANFVYAAPEQRVRDQKVDQRADIYALGLILNEMYTGEIPVGSGYKKVTDVVPAFSYLDPVIDHMIRQSPSFRPSTINEIRLELALAQQTQNNPSLIPGSRSPKRVSANSHLSYRAEVDSIGRLDDVKSNTVLSISAGLSYSLLLPATEKEKALNILAQIKPCWGITRRRVYLYSLLLYLLVKDHIKKLDVVVIDPEYLGYEPEIKGLLLHLLRKSGIKAKNEQIKFERIDRGSLARKMASRVFKGDAEPDIIMETKQIFSDIVIK